MFEFPAQGARPVWIASYPRSGNTFLRIILQNCFRLPSFSIYRVEGDNHRDPSAEALEQAPMLPANWRERLKDSDELPPIPIKTHGPPVDTAPAIFIARDGRAAIHSYFYYHKKFAFEQPSLTEVIAGACQFGSWSEHYWAWRPKLRPRTLLVNYDELVKEPRAVIPRLAAFLKVPAVEADLPRFEELQQRAPAFFRRGQNADYLKEWSAAQLALFNQLHATAMEELGFALTPSTGSAADTATELAQSAARLHRLYLEQLSSFGKTMRAHEQQTQELSEKIRQLSDRIEKVYAPFVQRRWIRLGQAVRALPLLPGPAEPGSSGPAANQEPATFKSSGGSTRSFSPGPQPTPPSVPNQGASARG